MGEGSHTHDPTHLLIQSKANEGRKESMNEGKESRNMDGIYFRVERGGKWCNICFSDLTYSEMDRIMEGRSDEWLRSLIKHIASCLYGAVMAGRSTEFLKSLAKNLAGILYDQGEYVKSVEKEEEE